MLFPSGLFGKSSKWSLTAAFAELKNCGIRGLEVGRTNRGTPSNWLDYRKVAHGRWMDARCYCTLTVRNVRIGTKFASKCLHTAHTCTQHTPALNNFEDCYTFFMFSRPCSHYWGAKPLCPSIAPDPPPSTLYPCHLGIATANITSFG